jgi:hypothetical protein
MRLVRDAEVRVAPNKHGFLALLLEAAERVPGCRSASPRGRILCVAAQIHVDGATLLRALERPGLPDWSTLDKLEAGTEIPLLRWLVALERITPDALAEALAQEVPAEPLSPLERRVLRATRTLPREVVDWFLDALDRLPRRPADSG